MSAFNPEARQSASNPSQKPVRPALQRVLMEVESFSLPDNAAHTVRGRRIPGGETVEVRLNTVAERAADRPKLPLAEIEAKYVNGDLRRESLADKARNGVRLISFDESVELGMGANGVRQFRAHWPKTMAASKEAEVITGMAHLHLREGTPERKAQAYLEWLRGATEISAADPQAAKRQAVETLSAALVTQDGQGRARDPFAIVRVSHEGKVVADLRVYPATVTAKVFDQAHGDTKEVRRRADAAATLAGLSEPTPGNTDYDTKLRDSVRAILAGLGGEALPAFASTSKEALEELENYFYAGVKEGKLSISVIAAEKMDLGPDTAKTYIKERARPHLASYDIRSGDPENPRVKAGFLETAVAVQRHMDGEAYPIFVSPVAQYTQGEAKLLAHVSNEAINSTASGPGVAPRVVVPEPEPEDSPAP